jgi:hypothetical protein
MVQHQAWSVHTELHSTTTPDSVLDEMTDVLAGHSPAVGFAPNGNMSVDISVEASTARQALDAALKTVTKAARDAGASDNVLGIELMNEDEQERRLATPSIPELCGLSEVGDILGVSRQRAGQLAKENNDFPPAVARLKAGPVYVKWQVEAFKDRWARRAGRPSKAA